MKKLLFKNLSVNISQKNIINSLNLELNEGDVLAILGPNGVGKSTFLKAIMKHYDTSITSGDIIFNDRSLKNLTTTDVANLGFYFLDQNPVELEGVKLLDLMRLIMNKNDEKIDLLKLYSKLTPEFKKYGLDQELLKRNVNFNFSGGQKKKNEMIQLSLFNPSVMLFDEVDSGVDIDTIKTIANEINNIKKDKITLIVSHQEQLLNLIKPTKCIVILNSNNVVISDNKLVEKIVKEGYKSFNLEKNNEFEDFDVLKNEFR